MGICWSKQIKSESHCQTITGPCPKNVSGDGGDTSNSGSNVSSSWMPQTPRDESDILQSSNLKSFTFSELKAITRDFRPDSVLGRGGFGSVYKGWVDEKSLVASKRGIGMGVAVKRLNQEGRQGHKEWLAEITYLGELHHPNLVKLIGYCLEDEHRLLVYEFMPRGSLENHLFRRGSFFTPLSWSIRMKVALGAARGLAFLHRAETKVIYRDFKSSNILLDVNYNAKLSDFGLARDGPTDNETHVSTRVMGTYGYAAPEYVSTGHLTTKSDVFSFGVVLLEIISGKRSVDKNRPAGEQNLVEWARPYLASKFRVLRVLDPRLEYQYSLSQAHKVANLALQCLCMDPKRRSTMQEVVTVLEKLQDSKEDHKMQQRHSQTTSVPRSPRSSGEAVKVRSYPRPSASLYE